MSGTTIVWGAGSSAVPWDRTPGSHNPQMWGTVRVMKVIVGAVGNSAAITTNQGFDFVASPRAYIYDVVVGYTAFAGAPAPTVDVYNAITGGSSYLTTPFTLSTITAIGGVQTISARFQTAYNLARGHDPITDSAGMGELNWENNYTYPRGTVFSVRASTAAAGTITNLQVNIVLFVSNNKGFGDDQT